MCLCFSGIDWPATWNMVTGTGAMVGGIATAAYAALVLSTLREMQRQRQEMQSQRLDAARPLIILDPPVLVPDEGALSFAVKNAGVGPALNVLIALGLPSLGISEWRQEGGVLAAGDNMTVQFPDERFGAPPSDLYSGVTATAMFEDIYGRQFLTIHELGLRNKRPGEAVPRPFIIKVKLQRLFETTPKPASRAADSSVVSKALPRTG